MTTENTENVEEVANRLDGNFFYSLKCMNCSLHYVVMSWFPEKHFDFVPKRGINPAFGPTQHYCPECGKQRSLLFDILSGDGNFLPFPYRGPTGMMTDEYRQANEALTE